jgi:phospholipase/carboxylesterase
MPSDRNAFRFAASRRRGTRPSTTKTNPHTQLDQNAPTALQEAVFDHVSTLPGVRVGDSHVSVPGARAFHLDDANNSGADAFMVEREFAHLHPASDGSLHAALPPEHVELAIGNGWAERHPLAGRYGLPGNIVMIYGPRDEDELATVLEILDLTYRHASGNREAR